MTRKRIRPSFSLALKATALAVIVVGSLSACTKRRALEVETPSGTVRMAKDETLRLVFTAEPPSLDFQKMSDALSSEIVTNLMDTLIEYDFSGPEIALAPGLATKWEPKDGARKWTLTLRPGVKWTDGVDFTAQQVLDGWKRLISPETGATYSYFLFALKNAKAFNEGKIKDFAQVGARATGPLTIEVELERPLAYFPQLLTHHSTLPARLDVIAKHGDRWTEPGNMVTLGPYKLIAWQHDKALAMERNDDYWGEKAKTKYIYGNIIVESSTALNLFEAGQVDALTSLPSSEIRTLKKLKQFRSVPTLLTFFFGMNVTKAPMDDVYLRRAMAAAVDRNQIVEMLAGGQRPIGSLLPPAILGFDDSIGPKFDPAEAKKLLAKSKYGEASKVPRMTLKINVNEDWQKVAENIQSQLKTNLGVEVEILAEDWKVFLAGLKSDPAHLFRWGWLADYPDPDNFMNLMTSYSENNRMRWRSARYDSLVEKGASEVDSEKRRAIYREAQKFMVEDEAVMIPLYAGVTFFLIGDRVANFPVNPMKRFRHSKTELKTP